MAKLNLTSGETIDDVPMLVAAHGYVANSIELTGKDVKAMRRLFERDPAGFRAFIVQFEARFPENRVPTHVPATPPPRTHVRGALNRLLDACNREFGWQPDAPAEEPAGDDRDCEVTWGDLHAAHRALANTEGEVDCPTCNGTGKEGRHSICRDCDDTPSPQPREVGSP